MYSDSMIYSALEKCVRKSICFFYQIPFYKLALILHYLGLVSWPTEPTECLDQYQRPIV